jgi:hypothetical protein
MDIVAKSTREDLARSIFRKKRHGHFCFPAGVYGLIDNSGLTYDLDDLEEASRPADDAEVTTHFLFQV